MLQENQSRGQEETGPMTDSVEAAENILDSGQTLSRKALLELADSNIEKLTSAANRIRARFCGDTVEFCAIINAKSGRCSENCKYCAQSSFYQVNISEYPLVSSSRIIQEASQHAQNGVTRFSIVTSGRKVTDRELAEICRTIEELKQKTSISLCASLGILSSTELKSLKSAGLTRYHHNLETSRRFFPFICTTHDYEDRLVTINAAQEAGLEVCSGGIIGLGETMADRIDMALELQRLKIQSVPVNVLNPIPGTPLADNPVLSGDIVRKTIALFRFILPESQIRLAGGRALFTDRGQSFFTAGANAAITGFMLTTSGFSLLEDLHIIEEIGMKKKES